MSVGVAAALTRPDGTKAVHNTAMIATATPMRDTRTKPPTSPRTFTLFLHLNWRLELNWGRGRANGSKFPCRHPEGTVARLTKSQPTMQILEVTHLSRPGRSYPLHRSEEE